MHVRDARPGEGRSIEQIRVAGWKAAYAGLLDQQVLDDLEVEERHVTRRESWLADPVPGEAMLVAESEGELIGFAFLLPVRDDDLADAAELAALYVQPERRYGGAGSALLVEGFGRMREPLQVLWVLADNAPARRFYGRHGFTFDGTRKIAERIPGSPVEVRYRRARLA